MNRNVTPSTTDSSDRLAEIRARLDAATPGPSNRIEMDGVPSIPFWPMDEPCVGLCAVEWLAHIAVAAQDDGDA
jgi:hypothetical protein